MIEGKDPLPVFHLLHLPPLRLASNAQMHQYLCPHCYTHCPCYTHHLHCYTHHPKLPGLRSWRAYLAIQVFFPDYVAFAHTKNIQLENHKASVTRSWCILIGSSLGKYALTTTWACLAHLFAVSRETEPFVGNSWRHLLSPLDWVEVMLPYLVFCNQCRKVEMMVSHRLIYEWCFYKPTTNLVSKCPIGFQIGMYAFATLPSVCD